MTKAELSLAPDATARAKSIWEEYQREHDLTDRRAKAAGIDPRTDEVCWGDSAIDIFLQRRECEQDTPLFVVSVGSPTYFRKGHRLLNSAL